MLIPKPTGHLVPKSDLEIVRSVSGNLNVFTEKFLRNEVFYWAKNALFCAEIVLMMGNYAKKQNY